MLKIILTLLGVAAVVVTYSAAVIAGRADKRDEEDRNK